MVDYLVAHMDYGLSIEIEKKNSYSATYHLKATSSVSFHQFALIPNLVEA